MAHHDLISDIDAFIGRHGMAESAFGRAAVNDWSFIRDVRAGRRVWPETEAKVRHFMATYRAPATAEAA